MQKKESKKEEQIIRVDCDCGHRGHFFALEEWDDDGMLAVVCEASRGLPFLCRVKNAVKYIFGDRHLNYTEVVLDRETTLKNIKEAIEKTKKP